MSIKAILMAIGVFFSLLASIILGLFTFIRGSGREYYRFGEMFLQTSAYSICFIFIISFTVFYILKKNHDIRTI
jgi:uncharacterized protein HemY